jgi:hypothetical protein
VPDDVVGEERSERREVAAVVRGERLTHSTDVGMLPHGAGGYTLRLWSDEARPS